MRGFPALFRGFDQMAIPIITANDVSYIVVEGPSLDGKDGKPTSEVAKYAITKEVLEGLAERKQFHAIAQLYGLVIPGLILSQHLFQGLNRYLYCDGEPKGDCTKYIFSRKPAYDYVWEGGKHGKETKKFAPNDQVFVLLVSKNNGKHRDAFPDIGGWIEHWNWVDEDPALEDAPLNWVDRYDRKVWSR